MGKSNKGKKNKDRLCKWLWVFTATVDTLSLSLIQLLTGYGYDMEKMVIGKEFLYVPGDEPVMLAAHLDTVHDEQCKDIFYDREKQALWSPQGIGGDDRAGIAGILELLDSGKRPHVIFLDKEECGGWGAKEAIAQIKETPDVKFIIELDRKEGNHAVFYRCDNKDFTKYITDFGFEDKWGSFSDISVLCPFWKIAGVNLSIGYHGAHTLEEYVVPGEWSRTVDKLIEIMDNLPEKKFEYVEKTYSYTPSTSYYGGGYYRDRGSYLLDRISILKDGWDLYYLFGGNSKLFWDRWIEANKHDIETKLETFLEELLTRLVESDATCMEEIYGSMFGEEECWIAPVEEEEETVEEEKTKAQKGDVIPFPEKKEGVS